MRLISGLMIVLLMVSEGWAQRWQRADSLDRVISFRDVAFADENHGWAVGYAYPGYNLYHTSDGGGTWATQSFLNGGRLKDVQFLNDTLGWITYNRIARTTDGGESWLCQDSSIVYAVSFINGNVGWTVGDEGYIGHTSDGGNTWTTQGADQRELYGVAFANADTGYAVGGHWLVGDTTWWGFVLRTTDGGATWSEPSHPRVRAGYSIAIVNEQTVWVAGGPYLLHTNDAGATWDSLRPGTDTLRLTNITFANERNGWAAGDGGVILHTSDRGHVWQRENSGTHQAIYGLSFSDSVHGWAVGEQGIILRYAPEFEFTSPAIAHPMSFTFSASPNPFNPTTTLSFTIPVASKVKLAVYDVTGRRIAVLQPEAVMGAGEYRVQFDGSHLGSGIYFARLQGNSFSKTQKLVLLK